MILVGTVPFFFQVGVIDWQGEPMIAIGVSGLVGSRYWGGFELSF